MSERERNRERSREREIERDGVTGGAFTKGGRSRSIGDVVFLYTVEWSS